MPTEGLKSGGPRRGGRQAGPLTSLALQIKTMKSRLDEMKSATVLSLSTLIDLRDLGTGVHATRLAEWAVRVAELLGVDEDEMRDIEIASLLHDIGKVGVPDSILSKPGKLTPEEFETVKKHPDYGWAILRNLPGFERARLFVLHHHERWDGNGYPAGLRGKGIPLGARIVSVVDSFDAMISSRSYREGLPFDEALRRLKADAGAQFDPEIVQLFVEIAREGWEEVSAVTGPRRGYEAA